MKDLYLHQQNSEMFLCIFLTFYQFYTFCSLNDKLTTLLVKHLVRLFSLTVNSHERAPCFMVHLAFKICGWEAGCNVGQIKMSVSSCCCFFFFF